MALVAPGCADFGNEFAIFGICGPSTSGVGQRGRPQPGPSTGASRSRRRPARGRACRAVGSRAAGQPTTRSTPATPQRARSAPWCHPTARRAGPVRMSAPGRVSSWGAPRPPIRRRSRGRTGRGPGSPCGRLALAWSAGSPSPAPVQPPSRGTAPARERSHLRKVRAGRAAAGPRRPSVTCGTRGQDLGREPLAFTGGLVDAAVVDAWRRDLDRPGRRGNGAGLVATVADHQAVPALVPCGRQLS